MEPFSPKERASIEAAITNAESKTSGEIIVVVATASAGYFAYALMWAALLALLVPGR
jgi:putative membrane protein